MLLAGIWGITRTSGGVTPKFFVQVRIAVVPVCELMLTIWQATIMIASMAVTYSSVLSLQGKRGLPLLNQVIGWVCFGDFHWCVSSSTKNDFPLHLALASLTPFVYRSRITEPFPRLLELFMGLGPCFIILSISVEGLFYLAFAAIMLLWIEVEGKVRDASPSFTDVKATSHSVTLRGDDVRISLFFLFFVQVAFFGTGKWVRFLTQWLSEQDTANEFCPYIIQCSVHLVRTNHKQNGYGLSEYFRCSDPSISSPCIALSPSSTLS